MSGVLMMVIAIIVLGGGYILYGRWLAKTWGIDPNAKTPAYELQDGVDYEPADTAIVFGHQFASIAGAGPINGPIQAAVFGWVPVLLWVPMIVMLAVTLTALVQKIIALIGNPTPGNILQLAFAVALFVLGVIVALLGLKRLAEKEEA